MGKRVIRIIDDLVAEVANEQKLDLNLTSENMGKHMV